MFLEIKDFLSPQAVARLTALAARVNFVDGRISNPANQSKNNLQASLADPGYAESSAIVAEAFAVALVLVFFVLGLRFGLGELI